MKKRAPKWILLGGCLVLCALNFYGAFLHIRKGNQHPVDSTSVSVYPSYSGDSRSNVPVQAIGGPEEGRVRVYVRHSYDDILIRSVAVPNLLVLVATLTLFILAERFQSPKPELNQSTK
jgi:hypothetical protein